MYSDDLQCLLKLQLLDNLIFRSIFSSMLTQLLSLPGPHLSHRIDTPTYLQQDKYCFKCKDFGDLIECKNCPKKYHQQCFNLANKSSTIEDNHKICECCLLYNQCPVCQKPVDQDVSKKINETSKSVCNVCCRRLHQQCHTNIKKQNLNISNEKVQKVLQSIICIKCLMSAGIHTLVDKTFEQSSVFWLVSPFYTSNLHTGWFEEDKCHQVLNIQSKRKNNNLAEAFNQKKFNSNCMVDKIFKFKVPIQHQALNIQDIIRLIFNPERKIQYGNPSNFKFLVKWRGMNTTMATWQDQFLVSRIGKNQLQDYLKYYLCAQGMFTIQQLRKVARSKYNAIVIESEMQNKLLKDRFSLVQMETEDKSPLCTIRLLSNILPLSESPHPILIISSYPQTWYQTLLTETPHFRVGYLNGRTQNRKYQLQTELFYNNFPMFDILVVSYEFVVVDFYQITRTPYDVLVLDCESNYATFNPKLMKTFENSLKIIRYHNTDAAVLSNIIGMGTKKTLYQPESVTDNKNRMDTEHDSKDMTIELTEHQRYTILRYIIIFGLNVQSVQQLLTRLISFQNGSPFQNNNETLKNLKSYLKKFLKTLNDDKQKNNRYYFWEYDKQTIVNRIANLCTLKVAYTFYKDRISKFPLPSHFQVATVKRNGRMVQVCSKSWKNKDDIELMRLILKYGYSNWKQICQNFYEGNQTTVVKAYQYLLAVLWPEVAKSNDWKTTMQKIIQIRSGMILVHKAFQVLSINSSP